MAEEQPLVSIMMNCYNGEKYLREAVESVLAQTYQNWEVIFWDNQSTDSSASIFKSYNDPRLRYYLAPHHTDLGGGRFCAWQYVRGEFFAILDADDVWLPTKLQKQIPMFHDPDVGIVISDTIFFNEKNERPLYGGKYPPAGWVYDTLFCNYFVSLETLVMRRSHVMKLSRAFDPDFSSIADFDLVVRLSRNSKLAIVPEVLARWRVHPSSDTWKYPYLFIEERDRWIRKQLIEDVTLLQEKPHLVSKFKNKNLRSRSLFLLRQNKNLAAMRILITGHFDHWHAWVILVLCLLPASGHFVNWIFNRRLLV
jgi:glycosyltransferase involved in cell wall biosynthesis